MGTCLVSASTGPMGYLLEKLATMLGDECKLLKGVRDSIIIIKDELEALQAFLVPDSEEPDQYTMLRADAVWDMYYKIEDKIDYCMLLVLHHTCPKNGIKKHMSNFKYLLPNKIRYQIAKNIRDIKNQIKEVSDRYRTDEAPPVRLVRIDPRLYAIYKDASELVGIDGPTYKLIEWLTNKKDESPHEQKVVSIVGCAGLGKTTLARQIYNKLQHNFECRAFLSISRSPNMTKIYENIFCQLHSRDYLCDEKGNLNLIIDRIREFIQDKRYLIVIDDVWDTQTWDKLNCALVKNSCGSVIITTTRINRVAQFCCSSHGNLVYNMQPLSVADSKKLFFKRVFGCEETCPSNLKEVSKDILKRCGGLPLAINAISSLLATGETEEKWSHIRSSIAQGENSDIDAMNYILSLSYFDLPHDLRSCLLYVTMFPADFLIEKERLIHRWISEGLIHGGHGEDLVKLGENFLNELVNRSLIETVGLQYDGKARFCRVHHAILDFLIFRSTKENFCTLISNLSKPDGRVCRLSLMGNEDQGSVEQLDLSHARSLGVCGHAGQLPPFVKSNALRVLDLQDCSELGNHHVKDIGRLFRLRYLNISGTDITELPIQIGDLEYLETLDASFTELVEVPRPVTGLKRLVRLFVSDETKLPDEIGNMKSLQELGDINAFKQSVNFLNELGNLTDLRKLGIVWDTNGILKSGKGSQKGKRLVSSLCKLNAAKLHALCITFYLREKDGYIGHPFLPALNSTREVYLRRGRICWISKWLLSLANLEKLYISGGDEIEQDDLRTVGSIPTLVEFKLYSGCLGPIIISSGFQQLERLELKFSFSQLMFELGSMPNLKKLDLHIYLSKFKSAGAGFDFGIQHLSSLASVSIVIFCEGVSAAYVEAAEEAFKSMVKAHPNPNRPILEMSRESADFMSQDESQNGAGRCFGE